MTEGSKKGWTKVAFGEIANHIAERVEPTTNDSEKYIGLEHLDSSSLTIRRWGTDITLAGTKLRMRKGDILFAKRNAYLKRVAIAPHDGLFSAHGMVLRAKPEVVLPEFLPFFMQSDLFMERAKQISVGSLSPTINWKTLEKEWFALPPLEEQRRIANLLICVETVKEKNIDLLKVIDNLYLSMTDKLISNNNYHMRLDNVILEIEYGTSKYSNTIKSGTPVLRIPNVLRGELDLRDIKWVELSTDEINKYKLNFGDILIVRTNGNPSYVGRCMVVPHLDETTVFASYLIRIIVNEEIVKPEFAVAMLNSPQIRRQLRTYVKSSAGNYNINTEGLRNIEIPMPNITTQDSFLYNRKLIEQSCLKVIKRNEFLGLFKKELIGRFL